MGGSGRGWRIRLASGWKSGRVEAVSLGTGVSNTHKDKVLINIRHRVRSCAYRNVFVTR
jgi:hypothetical protein